jgi:hypothetical protein
MTQQQPIEVRAADFMLGELEVAIAKAMFEALNIYLIEADTYKFIAALKLHGFEIRKRYVEKSK